MNNKDIQSLQKARDYAFLLLKFRQRSVKELYSRLKKKNFSEEVSRKTISFLIEKGFIEDSSFARSWIESRLKRSLGLRRIRNELRLKGIEEALIETEIAAIKKNYREDQVVKKIAQERFTKLKGVEPQIAKRRLYAYLLRRGFSPEIIIDALNQSCKQTS